jgi:hypothetical protein
MTDIKTIAFVTCTWGRPHISAIYRDKLLALQDEFFDYKFINIVVDSDYSNRGVFGKEFNYINYANKPLSNKWNFAIKQLEGKSFDYAILMGSDDTMDRVVLSKIDSLIKSNDWVGVLDIYFKRYKSSSVIYWPGYDGNRKGEPIGAGRALSSDLIKELGYKLFDDGLNRGLDYSLYKKIQAKKKATFKCKDIGGVLMDIKSDTNITKLKYV